MTGITKFYVEKTGYYYETATEVKEVTNGASIKGGKAIKHETQKETRKERRNFSET